MKAPKCNIQLEEVVEAYLDCRKNKRLTHGALSFEIDLEPNLLSLHYDLVNGLYTLLPSTCFVVKSPRVREVWASQFRDRIVHHIIFNRVGDKINRTLIHDTFACIKNRGTLYGINRLEKHIRSFTQNWKLEKFYLKCDYSNFFSSINKHILWDILNPKIKNEPDWLKELFHLVIFNDPTITPILNSNEIEFNEVPIHKRLLGGDIGLPIGNLTSQLLANVLLDVIDKYAKHVLKIKHYVRYVDDIIFLGDSPEILIDQFENIKEKSVELGVRFNPKKTVCQPVSRGVEFLGQVIHPFFTVPSPSTTKRIKRSILDEVDINNYMSYFKQAKNHHTILNDIQSLTR
jgi:hypothetical protein